MIKINLLPGYIVERRRVKALAAVLVLLLLAEAALLAAYVWAPAPFSLSAQYTAATARRSQAYAAQAEVEALAAQAAAVEASFQEKASWVSWVDEADRRPTQWVAYYKTLTRYFPADVVIHGLNPPSGTTLNLTGSTNSLMSAVRWYLSMLRCEMVQPDPNAVQFNPGQAAAGAANPRMAVPVSMTVQIQPEYTQMMVPVSPPAGIAGGAVGRAGTRGRMGAAPAGGAGAAGGGGMGGRGGRGGMRGGGRRGGM